MYSALKMIKEADSDSILFAHRASQLLEEEQNEEALILCEKGVKRFPFYAEGHFMLARCYQAMKEPEMAIEEFKRTLAFNPGHLKALKALAYLLYQIKKREQGNTILLNMALYDPLNTELMDFLRSEGLISNEPVATEEEFSENSLPEQKAEEEAAEKAEIPMKQDVSGEEQTESVEETEVNLEAIVSEEKEEANKDSFQEFIEAPPLDSQEMEELFPEEEISVDLDPIQDVSDNTPQHMGDLEPSESERDGFERNNINEHLEETDTFHKPLDLNQFDNTEDDFATLIEGYFDDSSNEVPVENEIETSELPENEEPAEEKPLLDTTVIFRENRAKDSEILPVTDDDEEQPQLDEFNAVANEIEHMMEEEPALIEEDMEEELPPSESVEALKEIDNTEQETPVVETEPVVESKPDSIKMDLPGSLDEDVNIEDILQNPSLLTPTFGEILIAQKKFKDAREVFMALSRREPENERFRKKIEFLNKIVAIQN